MNRSMSLDNMSLTEALSKAVNAVIRPPRAEYDENQISFIVYDMHLPPIPRIPISFPNRRGERLVGSLYMSISFDTEKVHKCIIYLHGNIGSQKEGRFIVPFYAPHGISVFCFDFSGSGNSGGKYVTLGKNEKTDVIDVIHFLRDEMDFQDFILWGRSMGAACAIMSTAILTHEIDQNCHRMNQLKTASCRIPLSSARNNSLDNLHTPFYPDKKQFNSDTFQSNESAKKLEKSQSETTPLIAKQKNLLLSDSANQSSSNSVAPKTAQKPLQDSNVKLPELANSDLSNKQTDLKEGCGSDSELSAVPRAKIRRSKSNFAKKEKSDSSLNLTSHSEDPLCKPRSRASLPAAIAPIEQKLPYSVPNVTPTQVQEQLNTYFLHQKIGTQVPKPKDEMPSQPIQKKLPKPPKPPKPPNATNIQHLHPMNHINLNLNNINDDNNNNNNKNDNQNSNNNNNNNSNSNNNNNNSNNNNNNNNSSNNSNLNLHNSMSKSISSGNLSSESSESFERKRPSMFRIPIKGIIVDSAYSSLEDMLNAISSHVNLGSISSFVAQWYIKRSVYDQVGLSIKDVQPVESAKMCWRVPMLLGHSPKDDFVPFDQAKKIYNAYAGPKELVILSGSHNAQRDENWLNVCSKFIATYFGIELESLKEKVNVQKPEHASSFESLIRETPK